MGIFVNEGFSGNPGDNLNVANPDWQKVPGATGDAFIASTGDRLRFSGGTLYYLSSAPAPSADYSTTMDIFVVGVTTSGPGVGVALRLSATVQTYYLARYLVGTGIQMYRVVNGASTLLGSAAYTGTAGGNLRIRLKAEGATISTYLDDSPTPAITATDSMISAPGYIGVRAINATTSLQPDNLTADDGQTAGQDGTASLTGVAASPAAGIVQATGSASASIQGVAATPAAGTIAASGAATAMFVGAAATPDVGIITASVTAGGAANAIMIGIAASPRVGTIIARGGALAVVGGVSEEAPPIGAPLGGVAANPAVGQIVARSNTAPLEALLRRIPLARDFRIKTIHFSN